MWLELRRPSFILLLACLATAQACDSPATPSCTYTLSATTRSFGAQGGLTDVTVSTGPSCAWTARSDAAWATVGAASGTGPSTIRVTVDANGGFSSRQATVTVADQTLVITEEGLAPCAYTLAPSSQTFGAAGGAGALDVDTQSHCAWTASVSDAWVVLGAGQPGQGAGTVQYTVAAHTGQAERVATIAVGNRTATVRQSAPAPCSCVLTPTGQAFGPAGGNGLIAVAAPAGCAWAFGTDRSWIRVTSATLAPVTGNATVRYDVEANTAAGSREGHITIGDQSFLVTQAGMSECSYAVSPVEIGFHWHGSGGRAQVTTQAGCPWTATVEDAWISVLSGASGSGAGEVSFTVPDFTADATRRAPIKVRWPTPTAGQNVWVTQEGCRYAVAPATLSVAAAGGRHRIDVWTQAISQSCAIGCPWTATPNVSWIRVVFGSPGAGDSSFTIEVDRNSTGTARTGIVTVAGRTLTVTQAP